MEDLTGRQFGAYRIVDPLGEGGMAAVYKAYQANMNRYIALKILPRHFATDPEFVGRFEQEAKVLAQLQHPYILPVHDYGEADGYTYIVMPFFEGGTLTNLLQGQPLSLKKMDQIISQVGDALDYAHARGIIHRDVKPSNVLLDERGNCMLVDFGIAKIIEGTANLTQTGGVVGTPAYMSPEQGRSNKIDHRSDIYALGVILYEIATGRVPYKAETPIAVLIKHINDPLPPPRKLNPALPHTVEQVILKAMAKNPDDRFATAGEMVKAMSEAVVNAGQPKMSEAETVVVMPADLDKTPAEGIVVPIPQKSGLPRSAWLIGGVVAVGLLLVLAACGLLLFNLDRILQPTTLVAASSTPTRGLEPSEIASLTSTSIPNTPTPVELSLSTPPQLPPTPTFPILQPTDTPTSEATASSTPTPTFQPTNTPTPSSTPTPLRGFANIILTFGDEGIGPGLFEDARSIAVDNNTGHILVGEYTGGRIQTFDENGKFITQWSVDPEMPLRGLDVDRKGNAYVVQSGLIHQYNAETGELIREVPYAEGWGFDDIVVGADGSLIMAWYKNRDDIVRLNANGEPTLTIPNAISGQTGDSELDTRVTVDGLGNIYALGTFNNAVFKFGPDGKFLDQFGGEGNGPGSLDAPRAIAVDGQGRVYVSELVGPIKVYDSSGQYIEAINIQAPGMRFDDQGNLYVVSRTSVVKFEIDFDPD